MIRIRFPPAVSQANFCIATLAGCEFARRQSAGYARKELVWVLVFGHSGDPYIARASELKHPV
jgi:hypothetical protein